MPTITDWFDTPLSLDWEETEYSFFDETQGPSFFTYPIWYVIPLVRLKPEDLEGPSVETPLWIPDLHPDDPYGRELPPAEGSYVIDLPNSFDQYLTDLSYDMRKKFRYILRQNESSEVVLDRKSDIEILWDDYVARIQSYNRRDGCIPYSEEELRLRKVMYQGARCRTISISIDGELSAVNVSYWGEGRIYDLACLLRPSKAAQKKALGFFATLKNIEMAIAAGFENYDMLIKNYGYKTDFGAREVKLRHYIRCSRSFAEVYKIPMSSISYIIE